MKRGRPKSDRARYPSGQVRPEGSGVTFTQLQRLRTITRDGIFGTRAGEMLFLGEITQLQADVAAEIAKIYGRHDRAIGCRRSPASPSYESGQNRGYDLAESDFQRECSERAMEAFDALAALLKPVAPMTRIALIDLCVHNLSLTSLTLAEVRKVLDGLAEPLGLRRRRRA